MFPVHFFVHFYAHVWMSCCGIRSLMLHWQVWACVLNLMPGAAARFVDIISTGIIVVMMSSFALKFYAHAGKCVYGCSVATAPLLCWCKCFLDAEFCSITFMTLRSGWHLHTLLADTAHIFTCLYVLYAVCVSIPHVKTERERGYKSSMPRDIRQFVVTIII